MSIARQLLREFRPLFRMLDEPFGRSPAYYPPAAIRYRDSDRLLADPFLAFDERARPVVDVTERGDQYILDAEVPGVSKENLKVLVGDGNQSITIHGKVMEKLASGVSSVATEDDTGKKDDTKDAAASAEYNDASRSTSAVTNDAGTQIALERPYGRNYSFTRTVWLPRPVDPNSVTAKLRNGVLSVALNKAVDNTSKVITVEDA